MYDLLIKNGRVIDHSQGLDAILDIGINGSKINKIEKNISERSEKNIFNATGMVVSAGLIDMHCHIIEGTEKFSIHPDSAGVNQGVTTVVDGGSVGLNQYNMFQNKISSTIKSKVYSFINLSSVGQIIPYDLINWSDIDKKGINEVISNNLDFIKGIKIRLIGDLIAKSGVEIIKLAIDIAAIHNLPIMVHIGESQRIVPSNIIQKIIQLLRKNDIISHVYTAKQGGLIDLNGFIFPELKDAKERGVALDVAFGKSNCSFRVARQMIEQGIFPDIISSDLSADSIEDISFGLPMTLSKFIALGFSLGETLQMVTANPSTILKLHNKTGRLVPGMSADISILKEEFGNWSLEDGAHEIIRSKSIYIPVASVVSGELNIASPIKYRHLDSLDLV